MSPERIEAIKQLNLKHFSIEGDPPIDWELVDVNAIKCLDRAREIAGVPFVVTSNHRTPEQDMALAGFIGAHAESPCTAFDIRCRKEGGKFNSQMAFKIIPALIQCGFNRVGINNKNNHIHADMSKVLPQDVLFIE